MTDEVEITSQELYYACDFIVEKLKSYGSYTIRSVKKHYPNDWGQILRFGIENKMFRREDDVLYGTFENAESPFAPLEPDEPKVDLFGADVVIDEIEPLKVPEKPTDFLEILNHQSTILERMENWMSEVSLVLKENMGLNYFEARIKKRMDDIEANFDDLKQAVTMSYKEEAQQVVESPPEGITPQVDPFLETVRKQLGSATELVNFGYKEETGNYWVNLKRPYRNQTIFIDVNTRLKGLGFSAIATDFFFIKRTRESAKA